MIQFEANNPGAWTYHCHIAWHASMGYNIAILERGDELQQSYAGAHISNVMEKTCKDWDLWSSNHTVDQIDAGI